MTKNTKPIAIVICLILLGILFYSFSDSDVSEPTDSTQLQDNASTTIELVGDGDFKTELKRISRPEQVFATYYAGDTKILHIKKDEYINPNSPEKNPREEIVRAVYMDGTTKDLFHLEQDELPADIRVIRVSEGNKHVFVGVMNWEWTSNHVFNIATGKDLFTDKMKYIDWSEDKMITWSSDDSFFTFVTFYSTLDDDGQNAVFYVRTSRPAEQIKVFEFGHDPETEYSHITTVTHLKVDGEDIVFDAVLNDPSGGGREYARFDTKTHTLTLED